MKIKKVTPTANRIVTTANTYVEEEFIAGTSIIDTKKSKGTLLEYQTVVAVGPVVRNINVGDIVCINPTRYQVRKYEADSVKSDINKETYLPINKYNFNMIELDGKNHLLLFDSDIDFIINEFVDDNVK